MSDESTQTSSIDLSITFFCTILILFVFIEFNFSRTPDEVPDFSIGQKETQVTVIPPTWTTLRSRNSFAVLDQDKLSILELGSLAVGIIDETKALSTKQEYQMLTLGKVPAPNTFSLTFSFDPTALPLDWTRDRILLGPDAECMQQQLKRLTVFVSANTASVTPLLKYAAHCGYQLRLEVMRSVEKGATVTRLFALRKKSFSARTIFK